MTISVGRGRPWRGVSSPIPELAAPSKLRYDSGVLRHAASLVALLSVAAAPAVTSTRLFCPHTGEEVVGCVESVVQQHAEVRGERCCEQRTFRALDGARLLEEQRQLAPAPIAIAVQASLEVLPAASQAAQERANPSVGPPAFLSHRALLI